MTQLDQSPQHFPNRIPIDQLRASISILELATHYGYQPLPRKGTTRPVLTHPVYQDTILIKHSQEPAKQVYQRVGDFTDAGTLIDFVRHRLTTVFSGFNQPHHHELTNITDVLYAYLGVVPPVTASVRQPTPKVKVIEPANKSPFASEQFDLRPLEAQNYLLQRHISPTTLQRSEFAGKVLTQIAYYNPQTRCVDPFLIAKEHPQHPYRLLRNVAFPYYDGQSERVTGLELRNEQLKSHALGSERYTSVFVSQAPPQCRHFFVMESVIDALSHCELRSRAGNERFDAVYFSTGGQLTDQQVNTITGYVYRFTKEPDWCLHLAFDNDAQGCGFDLQFIQSMLLTRLPLRPARASGNRINYTFSDFEPHSLFKSLVQRIQAYNTSVASPFSQEPLADQLISLDRSGDQLTISVPKSRAALSAFCGALLQLTGLEERVQILKAQGKDFNEELSQSIERTSRNQRLG